MVVMFKRRQEAEIDRKGFRKCRVLVDREEMVMIVFGC
jgi:hypothetical protein